MRRRQVDVTPLRPPVPPERLCRHLVEDWCQPHDVAAELLARPWLDREDPLFMAKHMAVIRHLAALRVWLAAHPGADRPVYPHEPRFADGGAFLAEIERLLAAGPVIDRHATTRGSRGGNLDAGL